VDVYDEAIILDQAAISGGALSGVGFGLPPATLPIHLRARGCDGEEEIIRESRYKRSLGGQNINQSLD
jgi:hypothetical protein